MKDKTKLILAVVCGLAAVLLVNLWIGRQRGDRIIVLRATQDFDTGTEPTELEEVALPSALYPNLLKEAPTADLRSAIIKTPLAQPIRAGEILLYSHLSSGGGSATRREIPSGMKAVSIKVGDVSAVGYLVRPGDLVDVLGALPARLQVISMPGLAVEGTVGALTSGGKPGLEVKPVLQAVEVLAVDRELESGGSVAGSRYSVATLLVSMEEAQKLIYVRDVLQSDLTLVLRSAADGNVATEVPPVSIESPRFDQIGNRRAAAG